MRPLLRPWTSGLGSGPRPMLWYERLPDPDPSISSGIMTNKFDSGDGTFAAPYDIAWSGSLNLLDC